MKMLRGSDGRNCVGTVKLFILVFGAFLGPDLRHSRQWWACSSANERGNQSYTCVVGLEGCQAALSCRIDALAQQLK